MIPLADETGREDLAWLGTGLAELLAQALAESPGLQVVDPLRVLRTLSAVNLPPGPLAAGEARQVAELLDAERLVTGRVRSLGGGLRVDLEVVGTGPEATATALSAQSERSAALSPLVAELGAALRERLAVPAPAEAPAPRPPPPAAAEAYARGLEALRRGDSVGAAPALEEAVAAEPGFTGAWVRLAGAYEALGFHRRALEAAARATSSLGPAATRVSLEARAREAALRGEPGVAQQLYETLIERYPRDVEARIALAEAQGQQGKLEEAVATLEEVVAEQRHHPRAWYLLGRYLIESGGSRRAVDEVLVHALVIQNQLRSPQGKAEVLNAMGVAYQELGELEPAAEHYAQAARLRSEIGDRRGYATSLKNLATVALVRGDFAGAESNLATAIDILNEIGDDPGIAELETAFGALEEERGRHEAALEHYRRALALRRDLGDDLALADSYHNVGYAYYLLGDYDNARVYWQQASDLYAAGGDRAGAVFAAQSLGLLQLARGEWDRALKSFVGALEESRALGLKDGTAVSLGNLGRVAHYQGRYPAALASYAEALGVLEELGDQRGLVEFTLFEAETLGELGMLEAAHARLARVDELLANAPNREQRAELANLRGEWHLRRGEAGAARAAFARVVDEAAAAGAALAALRARLGLGRAALAAGDAGRARTEISRVADEAARLGHAVLELEAAEGLARVALAAGEPRRAEEVLRRALRRARDCGTYGGAYRLHGLLARAIDLQGAGGAEAAAERRRAVDELARVQGHLTPEQRASFDRLPEVIEVAAQAASAPDRAADAA